MPFLHSSNGRDIKSIYQATSFIRSYWKVLNFFLFHLRNVNCGYSLEAKNIYCGYSLEAKNIYCRYSIEAKNIYCGYSLEASPHNMFSCRSKKNSYRKLPLIWACILFVDSCTRLFTVLKSLKPLHISNNVIRGSLTVPAFCSSVHFNMISCLSRETEFCNHCNNWVLFKWTREYNNYNSR